MLITVTKTQILQMFSNLKINSKETVVLLCHKILLRDVRAIVLYKKYNILILYFIIKYPDKKQIMGEKCLFG